MDAVGGRDTAVTYNVVLNDCLGTWVGSTFRNVCFWGGRAGYVAGATVPAAVLWGAVPDTAVSTERQSYRGWRGVHFGDDNEFQLDLV